MTFPQNYFLFKKLNQTFPSALVFCICMLWHLSGVSQNEIENGPSFLNRFSYDNGGEDGKEEIAMKTAACHDDDGVPTLLFEDYKATATSCAPFGQNDILYNT